MTKSKVIKLKKLNLKEDISTKYKIWMNDIQVHNFTKQKFKKHTFVDIRNFVREKNASKNEFLYGIFLKKNKLKIHIGNIKLGPINFKYRSAEISYFIGEKKLWGKGYMTLAIKEIIKKAKTKGIKKLKANSFDKNIGSKKALLSNSFKIKRKLKNNKFIKSLS